jgi:putative transposase
MRSAIAAIGFHRRSFLHAVWLYMRFTLSFRDVEDILAERGILVSHETIRRWVTHFGPIYARRLRARRPSPTGRWHLDEVFVAIAGRQMYLWRAVDDEGEVLDILVQARRDKNAALRLMRKLRKNQRQVPTSIVTDRYRAHDAALRDLGLSSVHRRGKLLNNRAENSHVRISTTRAQDARLSIYQIGATFSIQLLSQLQQHKH